MRQIISLVVLSVLVLLGCEEGQKRPTSSRDRQPTRTSHRADEQAPTVTASIPNDVTYSVIDEQTVPGVKRTLDIRLNRKVSADVLGAIALELKSADARSYQRTFICYYLPEMEVGAGAWATSHFNPALEVRILGISAEQEKELLASPVVHDREVIGCWLDESPFAACLITIFDEDGRLYIEHRFKDGSTLTKEVREEESSLGRRFEMIEQSRSGDHWVIDSRGNLRIRDNDGLIATAKQTGNQPATDSTDAAEEKPPTPGQVFLREHLDELLEFKDTSEFRRFGFGRGGRCHTWLEEIEAHRDDTAFSFHERVAVGDLLNLGMEYLKTKDRDQEYIDCVLGEIRQVLPSD